MPVYNCEHYLNEAIQSILHQSYYEFDFVIINDGSTDKSSEVIRSFTDSRIVYLENDRHAGLPYTLNRGLDLINHTYIIRMDADDISLPTRFGSQISFMDAHADVGLSGTWFEEFEAGSIRYCFSDDYQRLKAQMLYTNPIGHPTVIFRNHLLKKFGLQYDPKFYYCEDYAFWPLCARKFPISNIPEVLLKYRRHNKQISTEFAAQQKEEAIRVQISQIDLLTKLNGQTRNLYKKVLEKQLLTEEEQIKVERLFSLLIDQNKQSRLYDPSFFKIALERIRTHTVDDDLFDQ